MAYKVVVTNDAKENMQEYIEYILYEKKNQQAAGSLLDDFEYTKEISNDRWFQYVRNVHPVHLNDVRSSGNQPERRFRFC